MDPRLARILDANLNRAAEGARVVEEYARFVLEVPALSASMKAIRHALAAIDRHIRTLLPDPPERHRDTPGDVGVSLSTPSEESRQTPAAVARASCKRLEESLRVLEEYGKLLSSDLAHECEALRYRLYAIEPRLFADQTRMQRLREARLYVLVTEALASADAVTVTREALAGGADIIQLREKEWEDARFHDCALVLRDLCRDAGALLILNDRPHIAALADADGVHTGQGDLPVHLTRRLLGPDRIIGRSTSAPDVAEAAHHDGADYIGVGPVYETQTKAHRAAVGLSYVSWAAAHAPLPYFCIGSINRTTLPDVLAAGARAVAVCTAIIAAKDIAAETAWFRAQLDKRSEPHAPSAPPSECTHSAS